VFGMGREEREEEGRNKIASRDYFCFFLDWAIAIVIMIKNLKEKI